MRFKRKEIIFSGFAALAFSLGLGASVALAQQINVAPESTTVAGRTAMAISYPEGPALSVKFKGTERLPKANGEAKVERKRGMTEIEIELDEMKPATYFGGDYSTYVLWVVSPEGQTGNVGEFILRGNRSKLNVSTPQQTFALFVTAEPHFLVSTPSRFVVLENTRPTANLTGQMIKDSTIKYRAYEGAYDFRRETLVGESEAKGETRSDVRQAIVSVKLAERAGAKDFAVSELGKARVALEKTLEASEANVDPKQLMILGHETVRLSVEAEKLARERSFQAALENERNQRAATISSLKVSIEKAESDAERARLEQERKTLELEIERNARNAAQAKADETARLMAEESRKREAAEQRAAQLAQEKLLTEQQASAAAQAAAQRAAQLAQEKLLAEQAAAAAVAQANASANQSKEEAERIRRERDEAKSRLQSALGAIVETRTTARGIIVNLPDILFDVNRATLKPQTKETLSKICGIMQVAGAYKMSIEGHTDSTGSDAHNQVLSERRAKSVFDYLSTCGLQASTLSSKGLGETQPLDTNDTAQGRQKNRRVEIVIEDQPGVAQIPQQ
ncbi:MAG: OmpA family protein [Acidobacteria bacterium]|nr:OmpA family protein [Acidobacteriota bacterium]